MVSTIPLLANCLTHEATPSGTGQFVRAYPFVNVVFLSLFPKMTYLSTEGSGCPSVKWPREPVQPLSVPSLRAWRICEQHNHCIGMSMPTEGFDTRINQAITVRGRAGRILSPALERLGKDLQNPSRETFPKGMNSPPVKESLTTRNTISRAKRPGCLGQARA